MLQNARDEIADLKQLRSGHLSIGASHTVASDLLPDLMEKYRARHPQITLAIEAGWAAQITDRVTSNDLDLGLVVLVTPKLDHNPQLSCTALAKTELVFVAAPKQPLARKKNLTFELREVPLILNQDGCLYRQCLESRFAERGFGMNVAERDRN